MPPRLAAVPDEPFDPAVLVALIAAREDSDRARANAEARHVHTSSALAAYLARHGPRVVDGQRYVGLVSPGLGAAVVSSRVGEAPPIAAHASIGIAPDLLEGDAD